MCVGGGISVSTATHGPQGNDETFFVKPRKRLKAFLLVLAKSSKCHFDRKKCWSGKCKLIFYMQKKNLLIWQRMISMDYWN